MINRNTNSSFISPSLSAVESPIIIRQNIPNIDMIVLNKLEYDNNFNTLVYKTVLSTEFLIKLLILLPNSLSSS